MSTHEDFAILVHGTFGRGLLPFAKSSDAKWCAEGSECRHAIRRALGFGVRFETVQWSGGNSVRARRGGAERLAGKIRSIQQRNPTARIHLVLHSHAGSVAALALDRLGYSFRPSSVVCFSTPFIHARKRDWTEVHRRWDDLLVALIVIGFLLVGLAAVPTVELLRLRDGYIALAGSVVRAAADWSNVAAYVAVFLSLSLPFFAFVGAVRLMSTLSLRAAESADLHVPWHVFDSKSTCIIRRPSDEASIALATAGLMTWISDRIHETILSIGASLERFREAPFRRLSGRASRTAFTAKAWFSFLFGAMCILMLGVPALALFGPANDLLGESAVESLVETSRIVGSVVAALLVFAPSLLLVSLLVAGAFARLLQSVAMLSFGPKYALAGIHVSVSAEAVPPGKWSVCQLGHATRSGGQSGLAHATHSDPEALGLMEEFHRSMFGGSSPSLKVSVGTDAKASARGGDE